MRFIIDVTVVPGESHDPYDVADVLLDFLTHSYADWPAIGIESFDSCDPAELK